MQNEKIIKKLEPWLEREIKIIFSLDECTSQDRETVLIIKEYVIAILKKYTLHSHEMTIALQVFVDERCVAERFMREVENYLQSPFDLFTFDQLTEYEFDAPDGNADK